MYDPLGSEIVATKFQYGHLAIFPQLRPTNLYVLMDDPLGAELTNLDPLDVDNSDLQIILEV